MLKQKSKSSRLNNEDGMAIIEAIPIIIIVFLFFNFSLGFFGAIHSGILNSIAARNYAFETFRHRADLTYFRSTGQVDPNQNYHDLGNRVHGTVSEIVSASNNQWLATTRAIDILNIPGKEPVEQSGSASQHNKDVRSLSADRNQNLSVNPIWIRTQYGICLNAACGS